MKRAKQLTKGDKFKYRGHDVIVVAISEQTGNVVIRSMGSSRVTKSLAPGMLLS